jgi:NADH-quinone oxidoreductase subunit G
MRVWFLKETKSICTGCATGCNTVIGSRDNTIHRQTPRENSEVNECWMCDFGRLDFAYVHDEHRVTAPIIKGMKRQPTWPQAIEAAAGAFRSRPSEELAFIVSGKMTNEEMFLVKRLATALNITNIAVPERRGDADGILVSADRNPNSNGAVLFGLGGGNLKEIQDDILAGKIKSVLLAGEQPSTSGLSPAALEKLEHCILMAVVNEDATSPADIVLPSASYAEKRGSMINGKGRLQRLNKAINTPGDARDDWEILRDLIAAINGSNGLHSIEDLFRQMAGETSALEGLSLSKIGDLGVDLTPKLNLKVS